MEYHSTFWGVYIVAPVQKTSFHGCFLVCLCGRLLGPLYCCCCNLHCHHHQYHHHPHHYQTRSLHRLESRRCNKSWILSLENFDRKFLTRSCNPNIFIHLKSKYSELFVLTTTVVGSCSHLYLILLALWNTS